MAEHIIMQNLPEKNLPEKIKRFYSQPEAQESFRELFEKRGDEISKILDSTEILPEDKEFLERLHFADERPLASEAERERIGKILQGENFKGVKSPVTQSIEDLSPKGKE